MSDRCPALSPLLRMEDEVDDVMRWALVLIQMGGSSSDVPAAAAYAVGCAIEKVGERLRTGYEASLKAART